MDVCTREKKVKNKISVTVFTTSNTREKYQTANIYMFDELFTLTRIIAVQHVSSSLVS